MQLPPLLAPGLARELRAILTLYLGILLGGYNDGFSAIATPDIRHEGAGNSSREYSIPRIEATGEQLSWFGKFHVCIRVLPTYNTQCITHPL